MNMRPTIFQSRPMRTAAGALGATLLAGATGALVNKGIIQPIKQKRDIEESEKLMMKKYPGLKHENKQQVKDYFNVISQFSPKSAANPLVAGALVNKMVQFGGVDHKLIQDLVDIQSKSESKTIENAAGSAAQGAMSAFVG